MKQSPQKGDNRTGIMTSGRRGEEMLAATREFPPSSEGTAQAIADVRIAYAEAAEGLGKTPAPASVKDKAKAAVKAATGGQPTLLMDKLGERLAFEHAGARLYEALLSKHQAYGSFAGGPSADDLLHILTEEYEHADLLQQAIKELGGDPTALTPSANLAASISAGLPKYSAIRGPIYCSASKPSWWPSWPTTSAGRRWLSSRSRAGTTSWRRNARRPSSTSGTTCVRSGGGSPRGRAAILAPRAAPCLRPAAGKSSRSRPTVRWTGRGTS